MFSAVGRLRGLISLGKMNVIYNTYTEECWKIWLKINVSMVLRKLQFFQFLLIAGAANFDEVDSS